MGISISLEGTLEVWENEGGDSSPSIELNGKDVGIAIHKALKSLNRFTCSLYGPNGYRYEGKVEGRFRITVEEL